MADRLTELLPQIEATLPAECARLLPLCELLHSLERPASGGHAQRKERERHLLSELDASHYALARAGHLPIAERLQALRGVYALEAALRDEAWLNRELLQHWDYNENGRWEPNELDAYRRQVATLRGVAEREAATPRWYFRGEDDVYGPWPLTRVSGKRELPLWLVRFGTQTGWVRVGDLLK